MKTRNLSIEDYQDAKSCSKGAGENRDCAVVATALVCRVPYGVAHTALERQGRRRGRGTNFMDITKPGVESLGFQIEELKRNLQPNGSRWTPKTIGKRLAKGYWLCRVKGHVFAVVNGRVLDWTEGSHKRILHIYRVTKKGIDNADST